jgi:hypothetical protein
MKLSLHLLSAAAFAPLASAGSYETVFKFKDDFFLKFCGLTVGMGKADGEALIAGLNANVDAFKTTWTQAIKNIEGCEVVGVSINRLLCIMLWCVVAPVSNWVHVLC